MQCIKCKKEIKNVKNFCLFCGKEFSPYHGERYIAKKTIDEALAKNNFEFLWKLFDTEKGAYAEYRYEDFIIQKSDNIKSPKDFDYFTGKIKQKMENRNLYAAYLYGKVMRRVFRERGMVAGLASFLEDSQKCREGAGLVREAAQNGQTSAEWTMGNWLWEGNESANITKNEREAYRYLNRAAQKGHPGAMLRLGEMYNRGTSGLEKDIKKAEMWVEIAMYFGCKTKKVKIQDKKIRVQKGDVEEIAEFYGLGKFSASDNTIQKMQMTFFDFEAL